MFLDSLDGHRMESLVGTTLLITGASKGIGALLSRDLARAGATVGGVARSRERLDEVFAEVRSHSSASDAIVFDVTRLDALPDLVVRPRRSRGELEASGRRGAALIDLPLANGARLDAETDDGTTPLASALARDDEDVAELLRERGAATLAPSDPIFRSGEPRK